MIQIQPPNSLRKAVFQIWHGNKKILHLRKFLLGHDNHDLHETYISS
jgi:hypothetical protein